MTSSRAQFESAASSPFIYHNEYTTSRNFAGFLPHAVTIRSPHRTMTAIIPQHPFELPLYPLQHTKTSRTRRDRYETKLDYISRATYITAATRLDSLSDKIRRSALQQRAARKGTRGSRRLCAPIHVL